MSLSMAIILAVIALAIGGALGWYFGHSQGVAKCDETRFEAGRAIGRNDGIRLALKNPERARRELRESDDGASHDDVRIEPPEPGPTLARCPDTSSDDKMVVIPERAVSLNELPAGSYDKLGAFRLPSGTYLMAVDLGDKIDRIVRLRHEPPRSHFAVNSIGQIRLTGQVEAIPEQSGTA
jgi:hypothetical protein